LRSGRWTSSARFVRKPRRRCGFISMLDTGMSRGGWSDVARGRGNHGHRAGGVSGSGMSAICRAA
jgi:hypothetical protein